jgi:hypothetical protein
MTEKPIKEKRGSIKGWMNDRKARKREARVNQIKGLMNDRRA